MKKNTLIFLFIFMLANVSFADEISNIFIDKDIYVGYREDVAEKYNANTKKSHTHSIGVNFGSSIFYTLLAPTAFNIIAGKSNDNTLRLRGDFGFDIAYTLRASEKIDINFDAGFYAMKTHYSNTNASYNGGVYGLGFSIGGRFYINNKDRASGFFLMPKIGGTLFITHGRECQQDNSKIVNINSNILDFYISGEIGFRIDMSAKLGVNSVRPFLDISLFDIGFSYKSIIRFVPLPRLSIGILF